MKEQNNMQEKELKDVNGGTLDFYDNLLYPCKACEKVFSTSLVKSRKIGKGCSRYYEYQCPYCGEWQKIGN